MENKRNQQQEVLILKDKLIFLYQKALRVSKNGELVTKKEFIDLTLSGIIRDEATAEDKLAMISILMDYLEISPNFKEEVRHTSVAH